MCGICGEIRFSENGGSAATAVEAMTESMARRGPDAAGLFGQGGAVLGHRRLRIIDLSDRAQQPMVDSDLGLVMVYNGAIYNYPELRTELRGLGYRFFSQGDTEVILKAYDAWGPRCVERFNGMFAFAIWHRATGRVFMARDRLGIKPLYYTETADGLRFASSLPALLSGGGVDKAIDPVGLQYYLSWHAVVPAPRTILASVKKLPPASHMTIEPDGTTSLETYWRLSFDRDAEEERYGDADWERLLGETLRRAVARRMVADVPVGCLLSGGLDSSLIVALAAELTGDDLLHTFSIGFESVADEDGDEFHYSDIVARTFGTRHHQIRIGSAGLIEALEGTVRAMSEPMVSHDCVGFYLLSREVSRHVKVVQSGQGADEVFGGYHWYPPFLESADPLADYQRLFFDRDHAEYREAVHPSLHHEDSAHRFVQRHFERVPSDAAIDKVMHLDTTVMLVEDPVKRVDNMTMAWGLEARVPFLDHELVELAARMPARLKVGGTGKDILKTLARRLLPAAVIDRPKGYFPVPELKYIDGKTLDFVRGVLTTTRARERGMFNPVYIDRLLQDPRGNQTPLKGSKLWQCALLEYWLQEHGL